MWRKAEPQAPSLAAQAELPPPAVALQSLLDESKSVPSPTPSRVEARLTSSFVIEGNISGRDDLVIDGEVRGRVHLREGKLTVGPDGRVAADMEAQEIVLRGEVTGNIKGHDRVRIAATAHVKGEIRTRLISIEEGATMNGLRVNLDREERQLPAVSPAANSLANTKASDVKNQVPKSEELSQVHV